MWQSTVEQWRAIASEASDSRQCVVAENPSQRHILGQLRAAGVFLSPIRGMYAETSEWELLSRSEQTIRVVRTLEARHPEWVFCSFTAAVLHGLWVSYADHFPLHVVTSPIWPTKSTRTIIRHPMEDPECEEAQGVRVTSLEQTLFDCLAGLEFPAGLALADSALRISGESRGHFLSYAKSHSSASGGSFAVDCLAHADARAESGGESVARAVMMEQGFMVPDIQVCIDDPLNPTNHYRVDYLWKLSDGSLVAGELDGREKYINADMTGGRSTVDVLAEERLRESRLGAAGLRVTRFSYADVCDTKRFSRLLEAYGIPRGPARPRGRS